MTYKLRKRSVLVPNGHGRWKFYNDPVVDLPVINNVTYQETRSWGHQISQLGKGGDVGGPFRTDKTWVRQDSQVYKVLGLGRWYEGTIHVRATPMPRSLFPIATPSSDNDLAVAGASAISRTIPTNPMSSAAVTIGEFRRDGLPDIIGSGLLKDRARDYRKVGDEYLNYEFGWAPLMRDLKAFAASVKSQNKILGQLHKDNGKNVRVRLPLSRETTSTPHSTPGGYGAPTRCDGVSLDAYMLASVPGPVGFSSWSEESRKMWFAGCYTFHLPSPSDGVLERMAYYESCANKLYGTRLTPEVVWNLAPWSWAADWFADSGDIIHNVSQLGNDGLVLRYGYLMEEVETSKHSDWRGGINTPTGPQKIVLQYSYGSTMKRRTQASPYGFGLKFGDFSPKQIAITAALGISRAPRVAL